MLELAPLLPRLRRLLDLEDEDEDGGALSMAADGDTVAGWVDDDTAGEAVEEEGERVVLPGEDPDAKDCKPVSAGRSPSKS